jgi:hypothetical protein
MSAHFAARLSVKRLRVLCGELAQVGSFDSPPMEQDGSLRYLASDRRGRAGIAVLVTADSENEEEKRR